MRLSWRDGVATLFIVLAGLVTLAVASSWDWPLLGGYRSGVIALFVLAQPICQVGGADFWQGEAGRHPVRAARDPFIAVAMALGVAALVLTVGGLIAASRTWFLALAAVMGVMWIVTSLRHLVEREPRLGSTGLHRA